MQDDNDGAREFAGRALEHRHHFDAARDVQVVQGLVQQDVVRFLGEDHGDVGALALAARELVEIAVLQVLQVEEADVAVDDRLILGVQASLGVGKAPKTDQLAHGQARNEVVFLPQNRQGARQLGGLRRGHVEPADRDSALVDAEQAPDHGEQRGLARAVGAHERRNAARGDVERNLPDAHGGRILLDDGIDGDHRRPFRRIVTMNASPPTNSMMMETTPCVLNT